MINEDILNKLISEFSAPRDEFGGASYITRRRDWFDKPMEKIRPLLSRESLRNLSRQDAELIYNQMTVGGPKLYPRTFIENGIEKIRASLEYLLYGSDELATRFYNFAGNPDSEYRLYGVARAFASTALFLIDHHNHGIWNSAVDGGLKILGVELPKKEPRGLGDRYVYVVGELKKLQSLCGFEDLSLVDEFVELIFHEKIGVDLLKTPVKQLERAVTEEDIPLEPDTNEASHLQIQYSLVKIGQMRGYDVWVAYNDRSKTYSGEMLSSMSLEELPHFAGPTTLHVAKAIDVIWFKKRTAQPVCFFEIEHTTSMYSGLLRLNDVKTDYPIPQAFIVAPKERKAMFEGQIQRRTFTHSELSEICQFMSYEEVNKLVKSHEAIATILP